MRARSAKSRNQQTLADSSTALEGQAGALHLAFIAKAIAWMSALYALYYFPYARDSLPDHMLQALLQGEAFAAGALIGLFDPTVSVHATTISGRFPLLIVRSCSSLDAQALYIGTVAAYPARLRSKLLGVTAGIALLMALNLLRIAALYFIGAHAPDWFDSLHEELFPLLLVLDACAAFASWAYWANHDQRRVPH